METGLDAYIRSVFGLDKAELSSYSPLTLAYIGDAVYELLIRSFVVGEGNTKASMLHRQTCSYVKAHAQCAIAEYLQPFLTETEQDYYRRGRNAKSPTMAKNASMSDYRKATGFEALMGYLYLSNQTERMVELVRLGVEHYTPDAGNKAIRNR